MKRFLVGLGALATLLLAVGTGIGTTHAQPQKVTIIVSQNPIVAGTTSASSITASSTYYVQVCGLKADATTVVDTVSAGMLWRAAYTSGGNGCVTYSATAVSMPGLCGI